MAPSTKRAAIRGIGIGVVTTILGWGITAAAASVSRSYHDALDAKADTVSVKAMGDQLSRLTVKVDSANLRLQQLVCGRKLAEGCR